MKVGSPVDRDIANYGNVVVVQWTVVARELKRKFDRNGEGVGEGVSRLKGDPALIVSGKLALYAFPKNVVLMVWSSLARRLSYYYM